MSWVTLDDAAPTHRKQLAAGAKACWLWTCGLAYCDRQETKDGFIPEAVVKLLYPGLGLKDAARLVETGLWSKADGGYRVHDYVHWREKRFGMLQSERGQKGGSVSSDAKRQAALTREANKRLAQAGTTSADHNEPQAKTTSDPTTNTTSLSDPIRTDPISDRTSTSGAHPPARGEPEEPADQPQPFDGDESETMCPTDLEQRAVKLGIQRLLAQKLGVAEAVVLHEIREFAAYWTIGAGMGQKRSHWLRKLREHVRKRHAAGQLQAPGALEHRARSGSGRAPDESGPVAPSPFAAEFAASIRGRA